MELSARQSKLLKWIGYPLLAIVTLLLTITYSFPYSRVESQIAAALAPDYEVSIASIGPTLVPGGVVIDTMMIESRPDDGEDPAVLVVDRLKARVGFLRLLTGAVKADVDVRIGDGRLRGSARYGRSGLDARLRTSDLPLERLPMKSAVGLPMTGGLEVDVSLTLPEMRFSAARGSLSLSCERCTIGDGETQIRPRAQPGRAGRGNLFAQGGLTVPQINLGTMRGEIEIRDGHGRIEELSAVSPDGELYVTGELEFADPVMQSRLPGCIRFRLSEEFAEREGAFGNTNLWMPERARQADGFYAVPTEGTFATFKWNPRRTCDGLSATGGEPVAQERRSRPSITLRPDENGGDDAGEGLDREPAQRDDAEPEDESDENDEARERAAERAAERRRRVLDRDSQEVELPSVEEDEPDEDRDDEFRDEDYDDEYYDDELDEDYDDEYYDDELDEDFDDDYSDIVVE